MDYAIRYIWTPSSPSPHSLRLCQRAPSCGNNVRLALLLTGCRSQSSAQFLRGDQEPWAFRGGLAGEFQVSNALNLQQSNGKKSVISKEANGNMCVGMKGFGLSKVSWLQWVRFHNIWVPKMFISFYYFGIFSVCGKRMGDLEPMVTESLQPVFWRGLFWLINLNFFQQLPKEMLLFPSACSAREHG